MLVPSEATDSMVVLAQEEAVRVWLVVAVVPVDLYYCLPRALLVMVPYKRLEVMVVETTAVEVSEALVAEVVLKLSQMQLIQQLYQQH